jgi:PAS domain S-box-containing protein
VRVLIVDDQEFIRRGIRAVLSDAEDIHVCGEAVDGREAITKTRQLKPDIVVMDISMPRLDGIEATREIRHTFPSVRVLTLSQYELPDVMKEALEAGAATHVSKIYVWTQLVPALRRVQMGHRFFDGNFAGAEMDWGEVRRKRAVLEKALRDSEERFRRTFDVTAAGIGHVADDGSWLRVNKRFCEIVGYSEEEIQKLKTQDLLHPADFEADLRETERLLAGEIDHLATEKRMLRKDGGVAVVQLKAHAVRDEHGKVKYYIRVAEDARERQEAEEKLARAKHELQVATGYLDFVGDRLALALNRCSRDLKYVWANQNYARWLERPLERIVGHSILDVLGKQAFQGLRHRFDQVLAGERVEYEDRVEYEGIGARRISAAYMPTFDAAGVADGWVAMVQDITGRAEPGRAALPA